MTTDAGATEGQASPKYLTEAEMQAHISKLQSIYDRRIAEEQSLTNDFASRVTDLEARLEAAEARGYEDDDPRMVELRKQLSTAEKKARDADSLLKRFSGSYKNAIVEAEALKLARGDDQKAEGFAKVLTAGRTEAEVRALAKQIRENESAAATTTPAPPAREEIDLGRGSGRAGSPRITLQALREHATDLEWYRANKDAINAAKASPGGIPER
jgi:hypothetical protein